MRSVQKGLRGENLVIGALENTKEFKSCAIQNFPLQNSTKTGYYQIDIVLVCNKGIFSLEVKNWECSVECSLQNTYWRTIYPTREIMVKSPFLQNKAHCHVLSNLIGQPVNNVIVFNDKTKIINPFNSVISCLDIVKFLRNYETVYTEEEVAKYKEFLLGYKEQHDEEMFVDFFLKAVSKDLRQEN